MKNSYLEKFEKMRIAGKLASKTLDMITEYVKPGISTDKIDQMCHEFIRDNGGYSAPLYYRGYTKSLCTSLNHVVCHGIPSDRTLDEGDDIDRLNDEFMRLVPIYRDLREKIRSGKIDPAEMDFEIWGVVTYSIHKLR